MSGPTNINMQDYQNNSPLTAEKVQQLLKEENEARRPQRCCLNVSMSVVSAILMAGMAYCIYDIGSLRKVVEKGIQPTIAPSLPDCPTQTPPTPLTCPDCPTQITPTQPSCPTHDKTIQEFLAKRLFGSDFQQIEIYDGQIYLFHKQALPHTSARVSDDQNGQY